MIDNVVSILKKKRYLFTQFFSPMLECGMFDWLFDALKHGFMFISKSFGTFSGSN